MFNARNVSLLVSTALLVQFPANAADEPGGLTVHQKVALIEDASPAHASKEEIVESPSGTFSSIGDFGYVGRGSSAPISVAPNPEAGATIPVDRVSGSATAADEVRVHIREHGSLQTGEPVAGDTVYFEGKDFDLASSFTQGGGVQFATVIEQRDSLHEFTYDLDLPEGSYLTKNHDGSLSVVQKSEGGEESLVHIDHPWASDANGDPVDTSYEILDGDSFKQVVTPREDAAYPVVADPWLGKALIKKHAWATGMKGGLTLQVYPTWWGRYGAWATTGAGTYWLARRAFWNELRGRSSSIPQTSSMRDQLYCHIDVVRLRAPNKASWNLDTWRPTVSYPTMIRKACNP